MKKTNEGIKNEEIINEIRVLKEKKQIIKENGITLIALVVTVILLLILGGGNA